MPKCPKCNQEMKCLFTSFYCDCDKPKKVVTGRNVKFSVNGKAVRHFWDPIEQKEFTLPADDNDITDAFRYCLTGLTIGKGTPNEEDIIGYDIYKSSNPVTTFQKIGQVRVCPNCGHAKFTQGGILIECDECGSIFEV